MSDKEKTNKQFTKRDKAKRGWWASVVFMFCASQYRVNEERKKRYTFWLYSRWIKLSKIKY